MVTYTNFEYLEEFIDRLPSNISLSDYSSNTIEWYFKMYDILFKKSELYLEETEEEIDLKIEQRNPISKILLKNLTHLPKSYEDFHYMKSEIDYFDSNVNPSSYHCYKNGISAKAGFIELNVIDFFKSLENISLQEIVISSEQKKSNQFLSWKELVNINSLPPRNAALIYDPYFIDNFSSTDTNLTDIFDLCIPNNLDINFHFTLISKMGKKSLSALQKFTDEVKIILKGKYPFEVKFQIIFPSSFHDRGILSNYFWIDSGHSLDILNSKGKVKKSTIIKYNPINSMEENDLTNVINEIKTLYDKTDKENTLGDNFRNRLFNTDTV